MGIVVGPSLLGLITYTEFVSSLAHLGAIILLFTIGLEFDVLEIVKIRNLVVAIVGIILPWVGGFFVAKLFNFDLNTSVFIGTTLTATSIAITANVLQELGLLRTEAAKAVVGAAVIDDILALLALTISEGVVSGTLSAANIMITSGKAIGFIVIGILIGNLLVARLIVLFDKTKIAAKYPESIFISAMMTAFLYAMVADLVGLSAIVGAFLAGASFPILRLKNRKSFQEGAEHLQVIFASIFFVSLGVIMDLSTFSWSALWVTLAISVVAILTKLIGCGVPARLMGLNTKDSVTIGIGMVPRGEVAMIVALIGLNHGLIGQDIYTVLVLMSLLTTIVVPFILRRWLASKTESKSEKESDEKEGEVVTESSG
jgi:Kef-type K+ transport system membrane component KefB